VACGLLVALGIAIAVGFLRLRAEMPRPNDGWYSTVSIRRWGGADLSDIAVGALGVALAVALVVLFVASLAVHRWVIPQYSTLSFAVVGLACVGGLTIPWMFGYAAWRDRRRWVPLAALFVASVTSGSMGPVRFGGHEWSWWRSIVLGGSSTIGFIAIAMALQVLLVGASQVGVEDHQVG
jgi:hypothetical protein